VTLGGTAQIVGRVAAGVSSGGASEAIRFGAKKIGKKIGVDPKILDLAATYGRSATNIPVNAPVGGISAPALAAANMLDSPGGSSSSSSSTTEKPGITDAERERLARLEANKRRKEFQNMGRSSTILTGPGGLAGTGSGQAKTLLGM
jgi:hypothetical protein